MIRGIGTDVVEISRIEKAVRLYGLRIAARILSERELVEFHTFSESRQVEFLAGRFAAKEAIAKALGCGIAKLHMCEVDVQVGERGLYVLAESLAPRLVRQDDNIHVSISHSVRVAFAVAIWEIACQGCT